MYSLSGHGFGAVDICTHPEHKSSDSTFLLFLSHGALDGMYGTRHSNEKPDVLLYDTLFQISNNHNCPHWRINPRSPSSKPIEVASTDRVWSSGRYVHTGWRKYWGSHVVKMTLWLTLVQLYQIEVFGKSIQRMAKQRLASSFNTDVTYFQ